jgi:hypothetical protein
MRARLDDTRTAVTGGEAKRSRGHDSPTTCDSVAVPVRRTCVRSYLCTSVHRGDLAATSSCLSLRLELQIRGKPWRHRTPAGRARSACPVVRQGAVGRVAVVVARAGANQIHRVVPASRLRPHQSPDHIERLYLPVDWGPYRSVAPRRWGGSRLVLSATAPGPRRRRGDRHDGANGNATSQSTSCPSESAGRVRSPNTMRVERFGRSVKCKDASLPDWRLGDESGGKRYCHPENQSLRSASATKRGVPTGA